MRLAQRRFVPPWWAVLVTFAVVAAFCRLGVWQLDRAELKDTLAASYVSGALRTITLTRSNILKLPRYQRVRASGRYDTRRQILLDNMPGPAGRPGYHVWTLLELAQGGSILVNRGWLPLGATRQDLPDVSVGHESRSIVGRIDTLPRPGLRMGASTPRGQWPEVLYYPTAAELRRLYGTAVPQRIVLLDPDAPDGYQRLWQAQTGLGAERHRAYAVQWFGLALAVFVVFLVVNLKPVTRS